MNEHLSRPAAAVWQAFDDVAERVGVFEDYGDALAAFLRALADEILPREEPPGLYCNPELVQRRIIRSEIFAIAAELEGGQ